MKRSTILSLMILCVAACLFPVQAPDLSSPKRSIETQLALLKDGKADELRACFTDRLKDSITAEAVAKGRTEVSGYSLADLVHSVESGKGTAKIKMKNGRTLTVLIEKEGRWYADTIWFR